MKKTLNYAIILCLRAIRNNRRLFAYFRKYENITDYSSLFDEIQPGVLIRPYEYGALTDSMHFPKKDIEQGRVRWGVFLNPFL